MTLTEDEAKTKWCPLVRLIGYADSIAQNTSWNRDPIDPDGAKSPGTKCIASACMAWRQAPLIVGGSIPEIAGPRKGYCGAFGWPA